MVARRYFECSCSQYRPDLPSNGGGVASIHLSLNYSRYSSFFCSSVVSVIRDAAKKVLRREGARSDATSWHAPAGLSHDIARMALLRASLSPPEVTVDCLSQRSVGRNEFQTKRALLFLSFFSPILRHCTFVSSATDSEKEHAQKKKRKNNKKIPR